MASLLPPFCFVISLPRVNSFVGTNSSHNIPNMQFEHVVPFDLNSELGEKDEEKERHRINGEKKEKSITERGYCRQIKAQKESRQEMREE